MRNASMKRGGPTRRPTARSRFNRAQQVSTTLILAGLLLAGSFLGYWIGSSRSDPVLEAAEPRTFDRQSDLLAEQENRCIQIEQINLEQALSEVRQEADGLNQSLSEQEEAFQKQQEELEQLEENILNALMLNVSELSVSRSSPTVSSYAEKARKLLDLSYKAKVFHDLPEAEAIDITDYEQAIHRQLAHIPTLKPIPGALTGYGYRIHPIYKYRHLHPAVDMGAPTGTPIKAAGAGRVVDAGYNRSSGNYVKIDHGNGFVSIYYHCSKLHVRTGDVVQKGATIAAVGNTGVSTTPHLHFGLTFFGTPFNPNQIIME